MECLDFLEFQDTLKRMRDIDDKLIYALNATVVTPSFRTEVDPTNKCKDLYGKLVEGYDSREKAIKRCIEATSSVVTDLKTRRDTANDIGISKQLSKEQTKLRLLKSELNIEEVVKDRSLKLYYERCRQFYKPPNIPL